MRSYNDRVTETEVLGGIVRAVVARARAMTPEFDPGGFLEGLSGQLQGLIPHDRMTVLYLDEGGRTVSVFAEHAAGDAPRRDARYTLSLARASRYRIAEVVSSCVFAGRPSSSRTHRAMHAAWPEPQFPASHRRDSAHGSRCRSLASSASSAHSSSAARSPMSTPRLTSRRAARSRT